MKPRFLVAAAVLAQAAWAQAPAPASAENDDFQAAIVKRDTAQVASFIRARRPLDFNFNDKHGGRTFESPLTMSLNRNFPEITRALLDGGADPNRRDGSGRPPIHQARSAEAARLLVQAGADPDAPGANGRTAIAGAVERGDLQAVDALLSVGGRLDAPLKGTDLLALAIDARQPQLVRPLLARGFDVRATPSQAIWKLVESGDEETVKLLIQRGTDPNARGSYGEPLLVRALFRQRCAVVDALLDAGAQVKLVDAPDCARGAAFGCLSIQLARMASLRPPLLARLVAKGLDLDAVDAAGHTALSSLVTEQTHTVRVVSAGTQVAVARNAETGSTVTRTVTPHSTARDIPAPDNLARVKVLLERGADPNVKHRGATPLMLAVADPRNAGFAEVLLDHGGRIEFEEVISKEQKPFHVAAPGGPGGVAGVSFANVQGVLAGMRIGPLTWAVIRGRADLALRLLARGDKAGPADRDLLYFAAAFGQSDAVPELLKHTREVNVADRADVTPLMFAARAGHAGAVRALLAAGARVNARSARDWPPLFERGLHHYIGGHAPSRPPLVGGFTALGAARAAGHAEAARLLAEAGGRD